MFHHLLVRSAGRTTLCGVQGETVSMEQWPDKVQANNGSQEGRQMAAKREASEIS